MVARFGFEKLAGNLFSLDEATNSTISLKILGGCTEIMVWCGHPDNPTLGPVMQKMPGQRSSDFEAALDIACGRLLAILVTSRAASRLRTTTGSS